MSTIVTHPARFCIYIYVGVVDMSSVLPDASPKADVCGIRTHFLLSKWRRAQTSGSLFYFFLFFFIFLKRYFGWVGWMGVNMKLMIFQAKTFADQYKINSARQQI